MLLLCSVGKTCKSAANIVQRPTSKNANRVPFLLFAMTHIPVLQCGDQVLCGMSIEFCGAEPDGFHHMRVTAGGLCKVQAASKNVGVVIAQLVDGSGVVCFDTDQNADNIRVSKRSEDRISAQAFHAKPASHGVRGDAEAAQFTDFENGFDQW